MSKPPKVASRPAGGLRGAVSAPARYGAAPWSKTYVSKINPWTHGFFITINSMILYFKHIIHIDDFPLNRHPPSSVQIEDSTNPYQHPQLLLLCFLHCINGLFQLALVRIDIIAYH